MLEVQDQRRLGAIIVPNSEEALKAAKKLSIVDADANELCRETLISLLHEELRTWYLRPYKIVFQTSVILHPYPLENLFKTFLKWFIEVGILCANFLCWDELHKNQAHSQFCFSYAFTSHFFQCEVSSMGVSWY